MPNYNLEERARQMEELRSFTEIINKDIGYLTNNLGWTVESIANDEKNYFICPYDSSHRIMEQFLDKHLPTCQWKAEGYKEFDIPFPKSALSLNGPFSLQLDEELQEEILKHAKEQNPEMRTGTIRRLLPRTSDRLIADFTTDERKALYAYVNCHTAKPEIGSDIADISTLKPQDSDKKEMSLLELLVQERNLKRRRAKHRGVHTNKKSHIEILREVINQQMEIYSEYLSEQQSYGLLPDAILCSKQQESLKNYTDKEVSVSMELSSSSQRKSNGHHYASTLRDYSEERFHSRSKYKRRDRDLREQRRDTSENSKKSEHRHRSRSRERKSHKKHKHKSIERHLKKDKHKSQGRTHSRHRDKSR